MIKYNIADIDFACISPIVDIDFACIGNGVTPIEYDIDLEFTQLDSNGVNTFRLNGQQIQTDELHYQANLDDIGVTEPITSFKFNNSYISNINRFPSIANVTSLQNAFSYCTSLTKVPALDYPKNLNCNGMFMGTSVGSIARVFPLTAQGMYSFCNKLVSGTSVNLLNNATDLSIFVAACNNLETFEFYSNITPTNLFNFFYGDTKLNKINNISNVKLDNATDISGMFYGCSNLTDIANINFGSKPTSLLTNASNLFNGSGLDLTTVNQSNYPVLYNFFTNCTNLTNVSGLFANSQLGKDGWTAYYDNDKLGIFYNAPIENCSRLFQNTKIRYIDLGYSSLSTVTDCSEMFSGCYNLERASFDSLNLREDVNYSGMFQGCSNLNEIQFNNTPSCTSVNILKAALEEAGLTSQVNFNFSSGEPDCGGNDGNGKALAFRIEDYASSSFYLNGNTVTYSSSDNDGLWYKTTDELETDYGTVESLEFSGGIKQIISLPSSGLRNLTISGTSSSYLDFSYLNLNEMSEIRLYENSNLIHLDLSNWQNIGMNLDIYACPELKTIKALNCSWEVIEYIATKISDAGLDANVIIEDNNNYITIYSSSYLSDANFEGSTQPLYSPVTDINDWGYDSFSDHSVQGLFQGNDSILGVYNLPSLSATTGHYAMFEGCVSLEFQDLTKFDFDSTYGDQDISSLFMGCDALEWVNFSGLDLSNAYNESSMFLSCNNLKWVFAWGCNEDTISKLQTAIDNNGNSIQLIY